MFVVVEKVVTGKYGNVEHGNLGNMEFLEYGNHGDL